MYLRLATYVGRNPIYAVLRRSIRPYPEHGQDFHELMHVVEGSGRHVLNGVGHDFAPGQTWYVGPDDKHLIEPASSGMTWINVAFHDHSWVAFCHMTEAPAPEPLMRGRSRAPFDEALAAFHFENTPWALARFLMAALAPSVPVAAGPAWLLRAVSTLDSPESMRRGVPALLDAACVSPAHLSRTVRAMYKMSPTELVGQRRLQRAAMLLTSTSDPVQEIALECGYESLSYFHRAFRRTFGTTPLAFRRRVVEMP